MRSGRDDQTPGAPSSGSTSCGDVLVVQRKGKALGDRIERAFGHLLTLYLRVRYRGRNVRWAANLPEAPAPHVEELYLLGHGERNQARVGLKRLRLPEITPGDLWLSSTSVADDDEPCVGELSQRRAFLFPSLKRFFVCGCHQGRDEVLRAWAEAIPADGCVVVAAPGACLGPLPLWPPARRTAVARPCRPSNSSVADTPI